MSQNKSPVSPSGRKPQYSASLKSLLKGKQTNKTNRAGPIFACYKTNNFVRILLTITKKKVNH